MINGFYIWTPKYDDTHPLSLEQVVQVIEGDVWVTGMDAAWSVELALDFGNFGKCVLKN